MPKDENGAHMKGFTKIASAAIFVALVAVACDPSVEGSGNDSTPTPQSPSVGINTNGGVVVDNGGETVNTPDGIGTKVGGGFYVTPDGEVDFGF